MRIPQLHAGTRTIPVQDSIDMEINEIGALRDQRDRSDELVVIEGSAEIGRGGAIPGEAECVGLHAASRQGSNPFPRKPRPVDAAVAIAGAPVLAPDQE